jgi:hypothetical protein
MISVCDRTTEGSRLGPFDSGTFVAELEAHGLSFRRVEDSAAQGIVLLFASAEGSEIASLSEEVRTRVVLVADGSGPSPTEAEAVRAAAGLLGLVEAGAWRKWQSGLLVAWGFYGRPDIATAAGLAPLGTQGLQQVGARAALPAVVARFLAAAERDHGATDSTGR